MVRRRKSSKLGADPRGDTCAPAIATLDRQSSPTQSNHAYDKQLKPHIKRTKTRSILRRWKQFSLKHTWVMPLILSLTILGLYAISPDESNPLHRAIFLSYPLGPDAPDGPQMYGKGKRDIAFVAYYTIVMSFAREFFMQIVIRPMAFRCGLKSKAKLSRFTEQVYFAMYMGVFGPFGLYVMFRSPVWYFNTRGMFEGFPHRKHELLFKAYYLLQASFWTQQALVLMLHLEKPRKDVKELIGHHIITLALIGLSYRFHFAYMGVAVYITHDISDFFFATSKTLNYIDSPIVGPFFSLFICVWVYLRHFLNLKILWAILTEFRTVGPYDLNWETQQYKCWISQIIAFSLLASLQALNLFWMYLIVRVAKNFVFNSGLADERSDDEGDDDDEQDESSATKNLLEKAQGMSTDKPVLLVNGNPIEADVATARPEGIKEKRETA